MTILNQRCPLRHHDEVKASLKSPFTSCLSVSVLAPCRVCPLEFGETTPDVFFFLYTSSCLDINLARIVKGTRLDSAKS